MPDGSKETRTESNETIKSSDSNAPIHYHHHFGMKVIFVVLILILLMGTAFAVGRETNRNLSLRGFGRTPNISSGRAGRGPNRAPFGGGMMGGYRMMRGYGHFGNTIVGVVTNINGNTLTINNADGTDYTVNIASTTSIIVNGKISKASDLKTDAQIVVSGTSNSDGSISATIIRSTQ